MRGPLSFVARLAVAAALLALPGACSVSQSDLAQLERMQHESAADRTKETISCGSRDLVCARLIVLRGEACAVSANDPSLPQPEQDRLRRCAIDDAEIVFDRLPADATPADQADAALLVFDAARAGRDAQDPAVNSEAFRRAVQAMGATPGGAAFAQTLAADATTFDVLTRRPPKAEACSLLVSARQRLPAQAGGALADRSASAASNIRSAMSVRGCQ